jgi:hypothetical protein
MNRELPPPSADPLLSWIRIAPLRMADPQIASSRQSQCQPTVPHEKFERRHPAAGARMDEARSPPTSSRRTLNAVERSSYSVDFQPPWMPRLSTVNESLHTANGTLDPDVLCQDFANHSALLHSPPSPENRSRAWRSPNREIQLSSTSPSHYETTTSVSQRSTNHLDSARFLNQKADRYVKPTGIRLQHHSDSGAWTSATSESQRWAAQPRGQDHLHWCQGKVTQHPSLEAAYLHRYETGFGLVSRPPRAGYDSTNHFDFREVYQKDLRF